MGKKDLHQEDDIEVMEEIFVPVEAEGEGFLPEAGEETALAVAEEESESASENLEGTELEAFESADIEDLEFIEEERLDSILESILFASDRPVSLNQIKMVFKGTQVKSDKIRKALDRLAVELAGSRRGVTLEEVPGGYQLRTKVDNMHFLSRTLKARPFKLSGPALEVLAIVAYKQPVIKAEIDEIRGVESGHLLRALMEKGLVNFEGKSDLPGKPMQYGTTKKFLEIFGLRNLKELPTLSQIDELLPEGIDEVQAEKPTLSQITENMAQEAGKTYSEGEEELMKITEQLQVIETSTDFFEQEKLRQKQKRDEEKAQSLREALLVGEEISTRDRNWLARYDEALQAGQTAQFAAEEMQAAAPAADAAVQAKVEAFENDTDLESASFDDEPTSDDEELAVPDHDEEDEAKF
jgi:segregation and condensation protein B